MNWAILSVKSANTDENNFQGTPSRRESMILERADFTGLDALTIDCIVIVLFLIALDISYSLLCWLKQSWIQPASP